MVAASGIMLTWWQSVGSCCHGGSQWDHVVMVAVSGIMLASGTCYRAEHLKQLSETFRKHNIIVLSDEIYSRLNYDGNHVSIAKYYPEGTILSTGISKWASAGGWRLGYSIFPDALSDLRDSVKSGASHTYTCAAAPVQYAAITLFEWTEETQEYVLHERRILKAVGQYSH
ncbi:aspartate aminotransferase-like, partial [Saccoglossus kowalevskii]